MKTWIAAAVCAAALGLARPARAQEPTAAHLAAARDLMDAANDSAAFYTSLELGIRRSLPEGVDSTAVLGAVHGWIGRALRWSEIAPRYARLYTSFYTEAELRDIATFMRTPTGRKMASAAPRIALAAAEIGQAMAMQHFAELQEAVSRATQNPTPAPR